MMSGWDIFSVEKEVPQSEKANNIIDRFEMRKSDVLRYKKLAKRDKDFQEAISKDLTDEFLQEELEEGMEEEQNITICIIGKKGRGKSTVAYFIAYLITLKYPEAQIKFVYKIHDALILVKNLPPHSTIVLDEPLKITGKNKNVIAAQLANIIQMCREFSINFTFNLKKFYKDIENIDDFLELFGIDKKQRKTRLLWRDDFGKYLGTITLEIPIDSPEFKEGYNQVRMKKKDKWEDLLERLGKEDAFDINSVNFDEIIKQMNESGLYMKKASTISSFLIANSNIPSQSVHDVANLIKAKLDMIELEEKRVMDVEKRLENNKLSIKDFLQYDEVQDQELKDEIVKEFIADQEEKDVFQDILEGVRYRDLLQQAKMRKSEKFKQLKHFTDFKKRIQNTTLGYAGEKAIFRKFKEIYENVEHFGLDSNLPDIINHDTRQVFSVKTIFSPEDIPNYVKKISPNEIKYSEIHSYELIYLVYCMFTQKLYYHRYYKPQEAPAAGLEHQEPTVNESGGLKNEIGS